MTDIRIGGKDVPMGIDTGASLTVMSKKTFDEVFSEGKWPMQPSEEKIKTYTGERITPLGRINAVVEHGNQGIILPLVILKENGSTLFRT